MNSPPPLFCEDYLKFRRNGHGGRSPILQQTWRAIADRCQNQVRDVK
ncbi:MAG: hypothetical protein MJA27_22545 [Pseudanabaenales cyanobacterium]|nr:hypothetical protein [Pseudanabaenales cyanobacterium]